MSRDGMVREVRHRFRKKRDMQSSAKEKKDGGKIFISHEATLMSSSSCPFRLVTRPPQPKPQRPAPSTESPELGAPSPEPQTRSSRPNMPSPRSQPGTRRWLTRREPVLPSCPPRSPFSLQHTTLGHSAPALTHSLPQRLLNVEECTKLVPGLKDMPYFERLAVLKLPSLFYQRTRGDLFELYKHTQGYYTVDVNYINFDNQNRNGTHLKLKINLTYKRVRLNFLVEWATNSWNRIP